MFFIPGWLISLFTFPGVIVHEAAHRFFCDLMGVPVYNVCYFRLGNPAGYVIHARTNSLRANFLISIGPLLVNTILCALIGFSPAMIFGLKTTHEPFVFRALFWLAISIGMHAFPSGQDMQNFTQSIQDAGHQGLLVPISKGFSLLLKLANLLRVVWFDAIYAFAVAYAIPFLLLRF